jgi:hypothetical protein
LARPLKGSVLKVFDCRSVVRGSGIPFPVVELHPPYDWNKLLTLLRGPGRDAGDP